MPARKRPTREDHRDRPQDLLAGDAGVFDLISEPAPLHQGDNTFPGEVFLQVAAGALDWCGASRADPLPLEGLRGRLLPEYAFRGPAVTPPRAAWMEGSACERMGLFHAPAAR